MTDYQGAIFEIKSIGDPAAGTFSGYGAVFHSMDLVGDRIDPGAFRDSLAERKSMGRPLPMHWNHGIPQLGGERCIGVWTVLEEDGNGLRVEGKIAGLTTDRGRYYYERLREGAITGMSIGYTVAKNAATYPNKGGEARRIIHKAALAECSLVDDPAHPHARVLDVKRLEDISGESLGERLARGDIPTRREFESDLRERLGFTRSLATRYAGLWFKSLDARESGEGEAAAGPDRAALLALHAQVAGFSLPTLR